MIIQIIKANEKEFMALFHLQAIKNVSTGLFDAQFNEFTKLFFFYNCNKFE